MSGYFQRPSLRPDTFEINENYPQPTGSGLKAAFQTRINQPYHNDTPSYAIEHEKSGSDSEGYQPTGGLKGIYDRRIFGNIGPYSPSNDDLATFHYPSGTESGFKPAFQKRNSSLQSSGPTTSGLRGAFLERQQSRPVAMEDTISVSASASSSNPINMYTEHDHIRYQEIADDLSQYSGNNMDSLESNNNYPAGYHSIHRLSQLNNRQGGSNLKKAFEARTGGTVRRNLGGNNQKGVLLEKHANIIVAKMEQDEALMEDSPDAEELRRTALRDMPQCLTIKRCVKEKLSKSVSQKSKKKSLSCWKMFKYRLSMGFLKLKTQITDLAYSFELWYGPLKKIEGNFGTGVASFFKFLRWLFLLNSAIAIILIGFIVLPKAIYNYVYDSSDFQISDLITGEGYITDTSMYYGYYTNETINSSSLPYSMPHAYFFTILSIYFVSFAVIGVSAARAYRRSFIETEGGLKNVFANKIFCGWDYNIATKDAALLKRRSIYNELKELISDFTNKRQSSTFLQKFLTVSFQFFMNFSILCIIAATAYAIWFFLYNVSKDRDTRIIIAPIFINAVMTLMPMFFSFVVQYEDYKNPKVSLYLTLARTFLLGAVTIGVLVAYWLQNNSNSSCWETSLAQEFYRMIVFDFFISVMCVAVLDISLFLIYKYFRKSAHLEFDIAWNTMQIIYNQTLFWVGLVFSPLLPVVVVLKLFLCWYIRLCIVLFLCKPPAKSWRAAQTSTWFLVMTFLSIMGIGGLLGYIITYIPTSKDCGPFRNYEYTYELVTLGVLQLQENSTVWQVVLFITKPGVIAVIILFLCARVYYSRAQAIAQKEIVDQCRNMLVWTAKDKEFYYLQISQATAGQWQYKLHDRTVNPELYDPALCTDSEDTQGASTSGYNNLSSQPSGATYIPSSPTLSVDGDSEYVRYKKYS